MSMAPYFVPSIFCFQGSTAEASADGNVFPMLRECVERNGNVLVSVEDIQRAFGPQLKTGCENGIVSITLGDVMVEVTAENIDGIPYIDPLAVFGEKFGFYTEVVSLRKHTYYYMAKEKPARPRLSYMEFWFTKKVGLIQKAFYMEEVKQLIPYHIYLPTSYSPDKPMKMAVVLHGLGGQSAFVRANDELCDAAEKYGYIILSTHGYTRASHGSPYPMRAAFVPDDADPANPAGFDQATLDAFPLCEKSNMDAVFKVMEDYAVDKKNVFLFGNSMGSDGTYHLGQRYNTLWNAIAPCAGGPDFRWYPVERLKNIPVLLLVGTEDSGYDVVHELYHDLKERGIDATLTVVGGQQHGTAWVHAMDRIFKFFNDHVKE